MNLFNVVSGLAHENVANFKKLIVLEVYEFLTYFLLLYELGENGDLKPKRGQYFAFVVSFEVEGKPKGDIDFVVSLEGTDFTLSISWVTLMR